jgi:mono/diheme cytochrome c family protein
MATPFDTIYTSNITPDPKTGIGSWTADQFYGAMHTGRFPDGGLIYPAMPFGSYTKVTREDCDAIFAYLRSVPPVRQPNRPHDLRFPFNNRQLILGWRTLFFQEGEYQPNPAKSAEWNRGAYLVEGLGHCSMCHTHQRPWRQLRIASFRGRADPDAELVRALSHLEQGGRARRVEPR